MKWVVLPLLVLGLAACTSSLARDQRAAPSAEPPVLARVEGISPVRIDPGDQKSGDRLGSMFVAGGPVGLIAAATHEKDFAAANGQEYRMRFADGETRTIRGYASIAEGDCVLMRKDVAGRYLTPIRREAKDCQF